MTSDAPIRTYDQIRRLILPAAWFVLAVTLVAYAEFIRPEDFIRPKNVSLGGQGIVYFVRSDHRAISIEAMMLVFGAIYFFLGLIPGPSHRRVLAWGHFILFAVGIMLIEAPLVWLRTMSKWPPDVDLLRDFAVLNLMSTVGYFMMYGGLALFAIMLGEMVLRRLKR